jgi:signal transduction histidine kinase
MPEETRAQCPILEGDRYAAVTVFCERVTHDFNNLMLPMIAYPFLLRSELREGGQGRSMVDAMEQAANSMLHITQQLAALLPNGAGMQESADLVKIARNAVQTVVGEGVPTGVDVAMEETGGTIAIRGAPDRVCRLIHILAKNGVEAVTAKGGGRVTVAVDTENVQSRCFGGMPDQGGLWARVRVSDTGEGFDNSDGQRFFEPFYTTRRNAARRGAGLGLSIAYRIALEHGGWLTFRGTPRGGATFAFYAPVGGATCS